jgi:hypothetical protein
LSGLGALAVGVVLLSAAACGSGSSPRTTATSAATDPVGWLDGEPFSSAHALGVVDAPGHGAVVVDSAAATGGTRRLQARWLRGSGRAVSTDVDRPALIFPWAWAGPGRVYVAGYSCPEPNLDDIDLLDSDLVEGCGGGPVAFVVRILDLATGSWTEVDPALPGAGGRPVDVLAVGPEEATFAPLDGDGSRRVAYRVDLTTGDRQEVRGDPVSTCPNGGSQLGLRAGEVDSSGRVGPGRIALVAGGRVRDLGVVAQSGAVKLGCSDDALVLWLPEERATVIARHVDGAIRQERIALPGDGAGLRSVAQHNLGSAVAVWEDRGESFVLWQLRRGRWTRCGPRVKGLDPPDVVAVIDCVAITASSRGNVLAVGR